MLTTPLIPPIANALEAEAARKEAVKAKIQEIITQYKSLGWEYVDGITFRNHKWPTIIARNEGFSIHVDTREENIVLTNIFTDGPNSAVGKLWFRGHHLTPAEVQAIIRLVKGEEIEAKEELEETGALAEYNHRYNK